MGDLYTVGNENLKVSREDAIRIAQEQAEKNGTFVTFTDGTTVKYNLTGVADAHVGSAAREAWTAYPFWGIQLYTDIYRGINQIQVGIWADTGTIEYCHAVGSMGDAGPPQATPTQSTPSSQPATPPSETSQFGTNAPLSTNFVLVISIAVAAIGITASAVVIRRRKR